MKLVLIEGVGKQDTIKKYLGKDYEVFATKGHVRDLPPKSLAVDVNNNFEPTYEIMQDKQDVVKKLKEKAKKAEKVYLATDPDREGEAISWHLAHILNISPQEKARVTFNEITKDAVQKGIDSPREIDQNLVSAQQARRILDRLVGYKISPILCKKIQSNLSAGRVQSVALKLVVDREREIQNFVPEEYWSLAARLEKPNNKPQFSATLQTIRGKKFKLKNKAQVDNVLEHIKGAPFKVESVKKTVAKSHAPAPFTTSTMQQDAINKLGMSLKKVTSCAQELYEGVNIAGEGKVALVTYIRSDSVRVSDLARDMAKKYILEKYGKDYYPTKPNVYKTKGDAQDAHEAIRPINLDRTPQSLKEFLSADNYKLYKLIYERFLASQMAEATYNSTQAEISCLECGFKVSGKSLKFAGFTAIYQEQKEETEDNDGENKQAKLPNLEEGDTLNLIEFKPEQKFTKPPARFTESTLIKVMEEKNIGRPATYTPTITLLFTRKYVEKDSKAIVPTQLGFTVSDMVQKYFDKVINVDFTSQMEDGLDSIAEGKTDWHETVSKFYDSFLPQLKNANLSHEKMENAVAPIVADVKCEKCGAFMVEKTSKFGKFLACPNYPKCKNIVSLSPQKPAAICPMCKGEVYLRTSKKGAKFYACQNQNCNFISWDLPLQEKCPNCNSYLTQKTNKNETLVKCANPECNYSKTQEQK